MCPPPPVGFTAAKEGSVDVDTSCSAARLVSLKTKGVLGSGGPLIGHMAIFCLRSPLVKRYAAQSANRFCL